MCRSANPDVYMYMCIYKTKKKAPGNEKWAIPTFYGSNLTAIHLVTLHTILQIICYTVAMSQQIPVPLPKQEPGQKCLSKGF